MLVGDTKIMQNFFNEDGSINFDAIEKNGLGSAESLISRMQDKMDKIDGLSLSEKASGFADQIKNVVTEITGTIESLKDLAGQEEPDEGEVSDIQQSIQKFIGKVETQSASAESVLLNQSPFGKQSPTKESAGQGGGAGDMAAQLTKSATAKLESATTMLDQANRRADAAFEREIELTTKIREQIIKLAQFKAEGASLREIMGILRKGLKSLAALKEQWNLLIQFFKCMANLIELSISTPLEEFVKSANVIGDPDDRMKATQLTKDMIYQPAYEASKTAFLVNGLASAYVDISAQFLMPLAAKLDSLIVLDPDEDKQEIMNQKLEIQNDAKDVQDEIKAIVEAKREDFNAKVEGRIQELQETFDQFVPPIDEDEKAEIQEIVQGNLEYDDFA